MAFGFIVAGMLAGVAAAGLALAAGAGIGAATLVYMGAGLIGTGLALLACLRHPAAEAAPLGA